MFLCSSSLKGLNIENHCRFKKDERERVDIGVGFCEGKVLVNGLFGFVAECEESHEIKLGVCWAISLLIANFS